MAGEMKTIVRFAIDHSGSLGSLYDAKRDIVVGKLLTNFESISAELTDSPKCSLIYDDTSTNQNLLQIVTIKSDLRLNIFLKLTPTQGIASVIDHASKIDKNTRCLYFRHDTFSESIHTDYSKVPLTANSFGTSSTHIITKIKYGIIALIIMQLSPDHNIKDSSVFERICDSLINDRTSMDMDKDEEGKKLSDQIISTTVYSNIRELTKLNSFDDIYSELFRQKRNRSEHQRLTYTLTPISLLFPQYSSEEQIYKPMPSSFTADVEEYLVKRLRDLKLLNTLLHHDLSKTLHNKLIIQLEVLRAHFVQIKESHEEILKSIGKLVTKIRKGINVEHSNDALLSLCSEAAINRPIEDLHTAIVELKSKNDFIQALCSDGMEYCNVAQLGIKQTYSEQLIQHVLQENYPNKTIICLTDNIRHSDKDFNEMVAARKGISKMNFIYADFTYSTYKLKKMRTISPNEKQENDPALSAITDDCITILLLGESGVGKSTFINAFANYLRFESLKQAQHKEPIVIIPVSFLMTTNDFQERIIEFGKRNSNENHNDVGQSVTQQCKSYVFNISDKKKLRIIDTPGFGDTRGSDQDNLNMEEIFSFLKHFSYINCVCLLFKPEVIQLNPYLRSCCSQLFNYFGKNLRDHLIFCFTSARSTFFAPGNTRPLLNTFFQSFPVKNIPFTKNNTFCFDSESFRYLVALQNGIEFDKNERGEFEQSWLRSVTEAERFRDYLLKQSPYRRNNEWKSIQDAQLQINHTVRPILESMRNLLRNLILYDLNSTIYLRPIHFKRKQMICYACPRDTIECGHFLILSDRLHNSTEDDCTKKKAQTLTEYTLQYEQVYTDGKHSIADLQQQLDYVCNICAEFAYFLMKNSQDHQEDSFLVGFKRMLKEEKFICKMETATNVNQQLTTRLKQLQERYEKRLEVIRTDADPIDLCHIYCLINSLNEIPMVKIQLNAIKQHYRLLLKKNELIIPTDKQM